MSLSRCASAIVFLTIAFTVAASAQTNKTFPTDDEINLVLNQTERAMQQYKPLIDQEEIQMGTGYKEAAANDRRVVGALEMAVRAFKGKPQGFNGPLGFTFFEWLDDAGRNALLCSGGAMAQSALAKSADKADALVRLSQNCSDAATLIYTVSENAGSLYERYAQAEEQLAARAVEAAQKCTDILKKSVTPKK